MISGVRIPWFWDRLATAGERVLMLDYDGTLAPFRPERDLAFPYSGVPELIDGIMAQANTRIVVISGRRASDLPRLLSTQHLPEIWGSHGMERLTADGAYNAVELPETAARLFNQAKLAVDKERMLSQLEVKHGCLALHWRGLKKTEYNLIRDRITPVWRSLADGVELVIKEFSGGIELKFNLRNKGDAVNDILAQCGDDTCAAYLGDDLTDEDAFSALGGRGLSVLVRFEPRQTRAQVWLKPPGELIEFLGQWSRVSATVGLTGEVG